MGRGVQKFQSSELHAQVKCHLSHGVQQEIVQIGVYQWKSLKNAQEQTRMIECILN